MKTKMQSSYIPSFMPSSSASLTIPISKVAPQKSMLPLVQYLIWFLGPLLQLVGMIVLSFHGPSDGDTDADTTFFWVGWGVFAVGTIILIVKILMLRK
jgi:hypothetical protein